MGMIIVICQHQKERLFTKYFFLLLVTPDIPPVSGNNNAIKRLSSVRYFSQKKLQGGASICPHEKLPIKYLLQQESKQTRASLKNCVYLWILPKQAWSAP